MNSMRADFDPEAGQWKLPALAIAISALLHGALWSLRPNLRSEPQVTPPEVIEVSLIAPRAPPAAPQPAKPQVQPPQEPPKPQPKMEKPVEKPAPKKPVKPKPVLRPQPKPAPPVEPSPAPVQAPAAPVEAPVEANAAAPTPAPFVEASYRSPSLNNPPTRYPRLALERQWEGTVTLRVQVLASGSAGEIKIERSSGHEILDEATVEQVKNWRFIPARRGDQTVVSWVIIPIQYKLKH